MERHYPTLRSKGKWEFQHTSSHSADPTSYFNSEDSEPRPRQARTPQSLRLQTRPGHSDLEAGNPNTPNARKLLASQLPQKHLKSSAKGRRSALRRGDGALRHCSRPEGEREKRTQKAGFYGPVHDLFHGLVEGP